MNDRPYTSSDPVELSSRDSFPASDPPGWIGSHRAAGWPTKEDPIVAHIIPPLTSLDHVRGDTGAVRTLIEYGDYQCPFCAAAEPVVLEILRRHPSGLAHVFRHFPLASIHPMAQPAAETVEFAADHGAFWAMHSVIMARSGSLSLSTMVGLAELLGLSGVGLRDALSTGAYAARVRHDMALGLHGGVRGTPTFVIDGEFYSGPVTVEALDSAIALETDRIIVTPTISNPT